MRKQLVLLLMTLFLLAMALPVQAATKVYTNADVNLRKGPGLDYKIYTSVKEGTSLTYLNKTKKDDRGVKWYKVKYKKKKLWVSSRFATKAPQPVTPSKKRVVVTADRANLRKGPGLKYKVVADVAKDSSMKYLGKTSVDSRGIKWYKVSFYGKKVWISSKVSVLKKGKDNRKVITTATVNLRKGPSLDYGRYTSVKKGKSLQYLGKTISDERDVDWYKVYYKGKSLWVSSRYSYID